MEARASRPDTATKGSASANEVELRCSPRFAIPTNLRDFLEENYSGYLKVTDAQAIWGVFLQSGASVYSFDVYS